MITLKNPTRKHVENIYISFVTKDQLAMFALKVDFVGYEGFVYEKPKK